MRPGRNDLCHCGSNQKYKRCCEKKSAIFSRRTVALTSVGLLLVAAGIAATFRPTTNPRASETSAALGAQAPVTPAVPVPAASANGTVPGITPAGAAALAPQPGAPSAAPEGKVWSNEHGHWHDKAPVNPVKIEMATPQRSGTLQQPSRAAAGPAAGQVWSEEHKHYHPASSATPDLSAAARNAPRRSVASAPTAAKVWSEEHKHWHDAPAGTPGAIPVVMPPVTTTSP